MSRTGPSLAARPKLLILGAQWLRADALRRALEIRGFQVGKVVGNKADPFMAVAMERPDVIVADLDAREGDTLTSVVRIFESFPSVKALGLTARTTSTVVRGALEFGFQGCVAKDVHLAQVQSFVEQVLSGQRVVVRGHAYPSARANSVEEEYAALVASQITPREREVLSLLIQGSTSDEMARRLSISSHTLRTYLHSIFSKLQVHSRFQAATLAVRYRIVGKQAKTHALFRPG